MKRLFTNLFTSKRQRFEDNLAHEEQYGTIMEVDQNREWFVVLANHKIEDFHEPGAPMLILFQKKSSSTIARMKLVINPNKAELFIGDFESDIENKGYGSILLRNVIELAKQLGCKTIAGNLSSVDSDHFDKLKHLYSKYGFLVKISGNSGTILYQVRQ